ncbi:MULTISPECIES: DUF1043 family protein [Salinicola]|uniref:DUF1043 family protein n=1 Tax=Salinicola socius TaxID=404433 RepID=A0A1Q8SNK2_9GAMM|nr:MULTISPECIES: DUF1043 family protein [Salinicola]OLO02976.1 hypothetical protein BTW07_16700 [Salinicola socius]
MESIGVGPWIAIAVAVGAIGVLVGYWLGTKMGGHNTEPMRELNREHKVYKEDVREHFEQVSATMTRMVEDYREMYHHVARGAEKLADMHHETVIEPPPKPEAITQDLRADGEENEASPADENRKTATAATSTASPASASRATGPVKTPSATAPTASGTAAKSSASSSASPAAASSSAGKASAGTAGGNASGSSSARPQDAAIRAAAEDAATAQKR